MAGFRGMRFHAVVRCVPLLAAAALGIAASAVCLRAQTIQGTAVEEGTGVPLEGVIATLVDGDGRDRGAVLSDADGSFRVHADRPGSYQVRIERIGYQTLTSEIFSLAAGERVVRRFIVPIEAVELSAIEVSMSDPCQTRPETAEKLDVVWGEARKALTTTRLSGSFPAQGFDVIRRERRLEPRSLVVVDERVTQSREFGESPFSSRSAEKIRDEGWAAVGEGGVHYYGPDVESLLSDDFLDRHCFQLVREARRIGLAFHPLDRGKRVELDGILWLDPETAELRTLEFRYLGLPYPQMEALAGGAEEFARLDSGRWIIREWTLRAPEMERGSGSSARVAAIRETTATARLRDRDR